MGGTCVATGHWGKEETQPFGRSALTEGLERMQCEVWTQFTRSTVGLS